MLKYSQTSETVTQLYINVFALKFYEKVFIFHYIYTSISIASISFTGRMKLIPR